MASGALPARLPSTRTLAAQLGVSRNTVLCAYDMLAAAGLLAAKVGAGTWHKRGQNGPVPGLRSPGEVLRGSHYPFGARSLRDPDGNALYFHR